MNIIVAYNYQGSRALDVLCFALCFMTDLVKQRTEFGAKGRDMPRSPDTLESRRDASTPWTCTVDVLSVGSTYCIEYAYELWNGTLESSCVCIAPSVVQIVYDFVYDSNVSMTLTGTIVAPFMKPILRRVWRRV